MKKTLRMCVAACLLAALAVVGGCGGEKKEAAGDAKPLRVGSETTFAPFEFQDEKTKQYIGFDIDLMEAIGKKMNRKVEIVSMGFDALIPALSAGNIDAAISGMTITEERKQKVAFSDPYYQAGLSMVVREDNQTIREFKDLAGKKIGVQIGTTSANEAKKIEGATVREFNNAPEAFMELQAGGVEVVINDKPVNDYYLAQAAAKGVKSVEKTLTSEEYGIAVDKKNTDLAKQISKALAEVKQSGEYDKIYQKWFGVKKSS